MESEDTISMSNSCCEAEVLLLGAQLVHFQRRGEHPLIWLSPRADLRDGNTTSGGTPVCWPWFGPHPTDALKGFHGYARLQEWVVEECTQEPRVSHVVLRCEFPEATLRLKLDCGEALQMVLQTTNTGQAALRFSAGLHPYLAVNAASQVEVTGLEGCAYYDRPHDCHGVQEGPVRFGAPRVTRSFDRVPGMVLLQDSGWRRTLHFTPLNTGAVTVWNPGEEAVGGIATMVPGDQERFVCIEAVIPASAPAVLAPGAEHQFGFRLSEGSSKSTLCRR